MKRAQDVDCLVPPAVAIAHADPDFWHKLTEEEQAIACYDMSLWLRPDQCLPKNPKTSLGWLAGRGNGKSLAIAYGLTQLVVSERVSSIALAAPSEPRILAVQVNALVALAPPWCPAIAVGGTGVKWANGAEAIGFTPENPERPRSGNFDVAWMTEMVDWERKRGKLLYANLRTATRTPGAFTLWDTTSKGRNAVIQLLLQDHAADPNEFQLRRGSMLDSRVLTRAYIKSQFLLYPPGTREHEEEILGMAFLEATHAVWDVDRIDATRVETAPASELSAISIDPAMSGKPGSDEVGFMRISRTANQHAYVEHDHSARMDPEEWCDLALTEHMNGAAIAFVETNHVGDFPQAMMRVLGETRESRGKGPNVAVVVLDSKEQGPLPPYRKGTLYVKTIVSRQNKESRAEAASTLYVARRAHHVGRLSELENQMILWEPREGGESPNRIDALSQGLIELLQIQVTRAHTDHTTSIQGAEALNQLLRNGGRVVTPGRSLTPTRRGRW